MLEIVLWRLSEALAANLGRMDEEGILGPLEGGTTSDSGPSGSGT